VSTIVKAAAVQISPVLYSRQGTVEKVVRKIRELGKQGVRFATFPETVVPYYPYFSFIQAPIQNIVGPEQRKLLDQAVTVPLLSLMPSAQLPSGRELSSPSASTSVTAEPCTTPSFCSMPTAR
jgi:Carbon-nitrogen hydrolase